jgi:hypothetical protein
LFIGLPLYVSDAVCCRHDTKVRRPRHRMVHAFRRIIVAAGLIAGEYTAVVFPGG